jgi:thioredoxin-dependent peroxiredoxin
MKTLAMLFCASLIVGAQIARATQMEDFTLQAVTEGLRDNQADAFELKENRGKIVVLHFLLKTECPYCLRYTHQYAKLAEESPDTVHLFIKPDSVDEILSWSKNLDKKGLKKLPPIYRDPDGQLAERLKIPKGYQFHGERVHYPALVVLNGKGNELFRYVGENNSDRMSIEDFKRKLQAHVTE